MIFSGAPHRARARWIASLIALLDGFDTMLSSDADIEILRSSSHHRHLMRRLHALTCDPRPTMCSSLALNFDDAGRAAPTSLTVRRSSRPSATEIARIAKAAARSAGTAGCLRLPRHLAQARPDGEASRPPCRCAGRAQGSARRSGRSRPAALHAHREHEPAVLKAQMTLSSPVLRYALRLSLAMTRATR